VDKLPTLIFDLDDTLVHCQPAYDQVYNAFDVLMTTPDFPPGFPRRLAKAIDDESKQLAEGFSRARLPRAFQAASVALDVLSEHEVDHQRATEAWKLGNTVFAAEYPLISGARETLLHYSRGGWQLVLYSLGDEGVQWRKITAHKLEKIVSPENIFITSCKSAGVLLDILNRVRADKARTWVIGDSFKHDIVPAVEVGVGSIFVGKQLPLPIAELAVEQVSWMTKFVPGDPYLHTAYVQSHIKPPANTGSGITHRA